MTAGGLTVLNGGRSHAVEKWDAEAEYALADLILSYLHDNPPPASSLIADDLREWARRLACDGSSRLASLKGA